MFIGRLSVFLPSRGAIVIVLLPDERRKPRLPGFFGGPYFPASSPCFREQIRGAVGQAECIACDHHGVPVDALRPLGEKRHGFGQAFFTKELELSEFVDEQHGVRFFGTWSCRRRFFSA